MASKLTKKKAIEISKELWTWLAETGGEKEDWPGWNKYEEGGLDCPLCQYARKGDVEDCDKCPYFQKFGHCCEKCTPYSEWCGVGGSIPVSKKYAKLFLKQLEQL